MSKKLIAFTLIELLVVIAIIGILSGLIIVTMNGVTQKANIAKAQIFSNSLRNALMMNLIAEYKLDETFGTTANDAWGGHTNGTISGAVSYASCPQKTCYSFDGVDDYIELPDSSDLRMVNGGTISVWIYPKSYGETAGRIIDKSTSTAVLNGYSLLLSSNYAYDLYIENTDTYTYDNTISINQWNHISAVFSSSGRKLYVNGIDKTNVGGSKTTMPLNVSGVVTIGNRAGYTDRTFDGYIDEVRIYNAVIPTSQIKEQYYAGLNNLLINGNISKEEYLSRINQTAQNEQRN